MKTANFNSIKIILKDYSRVNFNDTPDYLLCEHNNTPTTWLVEGGLALTAESYYYTLGAS